MNKFFQRKHSLRTTALRKSKVGFVCVIGFISLASSYACFAQGEIQSGEAPTGAISPFGNVDSGTFSTNAGDTVLTSIGELSDDGVGATHVAQTSPIIYINDSAGVLGKVNVQSGATTIIGSTGVLLTDIAFAPNGILYGLSFTGFYRINVQTAAATFIGNHGIPQGNALIFGSNGKLYASGNQSTLLYTINPATGAATALGNIGYRSAGDLAFRNGALYLSSTTNELIRISLSTYSGTSVGPLGFSSVFGLATADNSVLYGFAGTKILTINPLTGAGTLIADYQGRGLSAAFGSSFIHVIDPKADFNADARPDWVLQRPSTGELSIWLMNDAVRLSAISPPSLPAGWTLIDSDQFGGVAGTSADLLLYNASTHRSAIWYMNGAIRLSTAYGPVIPSGWNLLLSQDFNGDAKPDLLLFQPTTRRTAIWYLNGVVHTSTAYGPTLPAGWTIAGVADFNRDERPDYLLYNASNRHTAIWYLNGAQLLSGHSGPTLASGWAPAVVDDFNRDGKPDLVITNAATHQSFVQHLNNYATLGGSYGPSIPTGWLLKGPK